MATVRTINYMPLVDTSYHPGLVAIGQENPPITSSQWAQCVTPESSELVEPSFTGQWFQERKEKSVCGQALVVSQQPSVPLY